MNYQYLNSINSPKDLKALPREVLPEVCAELRDFIVSELSHNPGHLGSSLGVIELTVALHYVFDTPYDRLVWDVGHQAYAHKILTGRRDTFHTNRQFGGLAPFPTPAESEYAVEPVVAAHVERPAGGVRVGPPQREQRPHGVAQRPRGEDERGRQREAEEPSRAAAGKGFHVFNGLKRLKG